MAKLIPSLNSCLPRMQAGEKRFARRLEGLLEDDYLCWYELPVGSRQRYSDFIILHPLRGLLLLEVKDWKLDTIQQIDKISVMLLTDRGLKTVGNPIEQVRQCTYQLINRLEHDPQLVHREGRYQGHLVFPYGYGVVLSNVTRAQFESTDLAEVLPPHQIICKDEMQENSDPEDFQQRLWNMFNVQFSRTLTLPQIDRIRWHLFPEVRINPTLLPEDPAEPISNNVLPDLMKVMDMQQEQLARSLGEGHRVIHGVAGSGKTLILGYRCLYLASLLHKPILVLCFNITLAAKLRALIEQRRIADKVNVYHFHDWCGEQLKRYHVPRPPAGDGYVDRLVEYVIAAADKGAIPKGQYGAVMVDEGHDFAPEWLKLIVSMVDSETESLLVLYDDAQSIYRDKSQLGFSLSSVGIQARGRTTVLRLNYRNTDEILNFAYRFASNYLRPEDADEDHIPIIQPEAAGRHGPEPAVRVFDNYQREAQYVAYVLNELHEKQQMAWSEMCVAYRSDWMGAKLNAAFTMRGIPCQWLNDSKAKKRFDPAENSIKLMTMHSSKGLEFPFVVVSGVGDMPVGQEDPASEAKLLYVAMTRSTEKLLVTSHRDTEFIRQMQAG